MAPDTQPMTDHRKGRRRRRRRRLRDAGRYVTLVAVSATLLFPVYSAAMVAQKSFAELGDLAVLVPDRVDAGSVVAAFSDTELLRYLLNSTLVATAIMIGQVVTSVLAGYAFASLEIPARPVLFVACIAGMMIPTEVTLLVNLETIQRLDWIDTYQGLIVPFLALGLGIFVMRQAFRSIHPDLRDAAFVDGYSHWGYMTRVAVPLTRPSIAATAVHSFLAAWNQYLWPLLVTNDDRHRTVQIGLKALASETGSGQRNSLVVSAGDLIGASPLLSALFHDEPTIEAMNAIGLDYNAVGNHEFDEGADELLRMQDGGCHPVDGCLDGDGFAGADFSFLAANVVRQATGETIFPGYAIENFQGIKVALVGMTLEGTPTIVSPSGVAGLEFRDEADTVNEIVERLRRRVDVVVVLLHEGGTPAAFAINGCSGISGPVVDIVRRMSDEVDLVISGHTHQPYNCVIDGTPVTSAFSFGRLVTDIDLQVSNRTKQIVSLSINNRIVTRDVAADPTMTGLIARYDALARPIANRPIGRITADITRTADPSRETALGNAIADGQLAATAGPAVGSAVMAFMNPGGVRADLTFAASGTEGDGVVTYGEAFTVQPFGNSLVTMTLSGAQVKALLEQQFCGTNDTSFRVLHPSAGIRYTWNSVLAAAADPNCSANNVVTGITLNGVPLDPAAAYRVTVNSFLADGGDGFSVLIGGTNRLGGAVDLDAFEAYLVAQGQLAPPATNRIDVIP